MKSISIYIIILLFTLPYFANSQNCDTSLWSHVYHSYRLVIHDTCTSVTGIVNDLIYEEDGDIHVRLHLDSAYTNLLNSANINDEYGDLVLEPICATTCTQTDAIASCENFTNTVFIPNIGEYIKATGSYVTDNDHGWNEIHPVTSIVILNPTGISQLPNNEIINSLQLFPNPANDEINFSFEKHPSSPISISIVDDLGRNAGQYQLMETSRLHINTSYLPAGTYYYNIRQNNADLKSGKFIVAH